MNSSRLYELIGAYSRFQNGVYIYIPHKLYPRRGSRGISDIPLRRPRFSKITYTYVTGKPIVVWSQSIFGESAINPLVAFYDI
jgi:hypothetical protein